MSGCRYLPRVVGSNCFETGAIVRHETGTGGPKYPIAPGDSWPAPVIRNNRTEFELRVLCVGILRSIPRTAPPCFQYTGFSLRRRFFPSLPSRQPVPPNPYPQFPIPISLPPAVHQNRNQEQRSAASCVSGMYVCMCVCMYVCTLCVSVNVSGSVSVSVSAQVGEWKCTLCM